MCVGWGNLLPKLALDWVGWLVEVKLVSSSDCWSLMCVEDLNIYSPTLTRTIEQPATCCKNLVISRGFGTWSLFERLMILVSLFRALTCWILTLKRMETGGGFFTSSHLSMCRLSEFRKGVSVSPHRRSRHFSTLGEPFKSHHTTTYCGQPSCTFSYGRRSKKSTSTSENFESRENWRDKYETSQAK